MRSRCKMVNAAILFFLLLLFKSCEPQNAMQSKMVSIVDNITRRDFSEFSPDRPLCVLVRVNEAEDVQSSLRLLTYNEELSLVDLMLMKINENYKWSIQIVTEAENIYSDVIYSHYRVTPFMHGDYIVLYNDDKQYFRKLVEQILLVKRYMSANPKGKMLFVQTEACPTCIYIEHMKEAIDFCSFTTCVFVIPESSPAQGIRHATHISLHRMYPFEQDPCHWKALAGVKVAEIRIGKEYELPSDFDLFPVELPSNCTGCILKVMLVGTSPYIIKNNIGHLEGVCMECLFLFLQKFKLVMEYFEYPDITGLKDKIRISLRSDAKAHTCVVEGWCDIAVGILNTLVADVVTSYKMEPSSFETEKFLVPCPREISRPTRVLQTFGLTVWIAMAVTFVAVSLAFWITSLKQLEASNFRTVSMSTYNAWSILLGVSIPDMPKSTKLRILFLLYVSFCFIISTVFQAFFTSYLVNPGYGEKIQSLDEAMKTSLKFMMIKSTTSVIGMETMYQMINFTKGDVCHDGTICLEDTISNKGIFTLTLTGYAKLVASGMGYRNPENVLCFLDDYSYQVSLGVAIHEGSPYYKELHRVTNVCKESGIVLRYWSIYTFKSLLKSNNLQNENEYFVFNLQHLSPVFYLLALGLAASFLVFVVECFVKASGCSLPKKKKQTSIIISIQERLYGIY